MVVGIGAPTAERAGWGGAAVVLRAGESPVHGEGRQRLREGKEAVMPQDATPNGDAPPERAVGPYRRVVEMQAKLHRWAAADPGRRFDDLFNLVHDPATLLMAYVRVAGNLGARTPGVDGLTVADLEARIGVPGFLNDLRASLKDGSFRPLPVRERKIPKPGGSGKVRKLGIPTVADRVVQAALKLVLEPIFEADFEPVSFGFRPLRRAQDAVADIQMYGTHGYRWVLDADIEACFDSIGHVALMDRVRLRVKDKRVLALVKAFLKAGVLTEHGDRQDTHTGTPQGGILSPLLANIALTVLDEHLMEPWQPGGTMASAYARAKLRKHGSATWRLVRYADDFVILVHGNEEHVRQLHEDVARVLAPLGLRLSPAKTRIVHMSDGFDFLGFHIRWRRKRGSNKWHVYTFIAKRPIRSIKAKIRALTRRRSQQDLASVLTRLNAVMHGWANYFRHAVAKDTFSMLDSFAWRRLSSMLMLRHRWNWTAFRRRHTTPTGRWLPISADGIEYRRIAAIPVTRYRWRSTTIPSPWPAPANA
ncbi:RNA-directed DNA polymerase [Allocatelliglobosispora scoriae]|uniref:RNA-directed DNA polymerase n=1 Tax=Allocatelliglobosispora scoriae TaxID=643052 RepID=A0A841BYQ0_9ACTN|nr:group II intron reverse transcriptase/maturase [Allocatelliglobosispora scoriae]MBB5871932.1 RNA-directed DNA polymerase [Allocatelliglobosispora scoriae]